MISVKSAAEIAAMARAAEIVVQALGAARPCLVPGRDTASLDGIIREVIETNGGRPAFLGYMGYPASSCISLNAEIVHGIPSPRRRINDGDLVSVDVGVEWEGYFADAAFTVAVGVPSQEAERLLRCGRACLSEAIARCRAGRRIGDISQAIESTAASKGYHVVREYVGHGIGTKMHEEPQVPNYGPADRGPKLAAGMAVALEPMVVGGDWRTKVAADGWTVSTRDGKPAVHFEHTVVVMPDEPLILTRGWEELIPWVNEV